MTGTTMTTRANRFETSQEPRRSVRFLEASATARAQDPAAIARARIAAGYDDEVGRQRVEQHRGRLSEQGDRENLVEESKKKKQSHRKMNTPPTSIGEQNDSNARRFVNTALRTVAKVIKSIHFKKPEPSLVDNESSDNDDDEEVSLVFFIG